MMTESISKRLSMFMAMLAMAMIATLMSASLAFADTYVTVNVPNPSGTDYPASIDLTAMASGANYTANDNPFFAQFYKMTPDDPSPSYGWNVLVAPANQYVVVEDVLRAAVNQYNASDVAADEGTVAFADLWNSTSTLSLTSSTGVYNKYYPSYADVSTASYFYDTMTNAASAFSSTYRTTPSFQFNGDDIANPQVAGSILALSYYQTMPSSATDMTSCVSLAGTAMNNGTPKTDCPRMLMGGFDGGSVAGKRFCSRVTEITL